jgi:hypothetical protein
MRAFPKQHGPRRNRGSRCEAAKRRAYLLRGDGRECCGLWRRPAIRRYATSAMVLAIDRLTRAVGNFQLLSRRSLGLWLCRTSTPAVGRAVVLLVGLLDACQRSATTSLLGDAIRLWARLTALAAEPLTQLEVARRGKFPLIAANELAQNWRPLQRLDGRQQSGKRDQEFRANSADVHHVQSVEKRT